MKINITRVLFALLFVLNCLLAVQYITLFSKLVDKQQLQLDLCPISPPNLVGVLNPDVINVTLESIESRFEDVLKPGGYYAPSECVARDRVAVIVPVRDRDFQIPILLKNLHPIMMRQQLEYQIFIAFQAPKYWFNKGALFNAGFLEAMKFKNWDCIILQDVDTIPADDRNLYNCPRTNPRHMAVAVDKFQFK